MKNLYTLLFVLVSLFASNNVLAQNLVLYGLQNNNINTDPNDPLGGPMELVAIDGFSGQVTPLFEIGTSAGVSLGSSTYDHLNQRYIFWGVNTNGENRLYIVNSITGELLESANTAPPLEMEYDLQNQVCYGLRQQAVGHPEFVSIDLNTGAVTGIAQMPYVSGINVSSSTFDSNNGRYMFVGVDQSYQNRLYVIDAATGTLLHDALIPDDYYLNTIEYNENNNQLYGIKRIVTFSDPDPMDPFPMPYAEAYLAVVDPQTADLSLVMDQPFLSGENWGYQLGGTSFDKNSELFVMRWVDSLGTSKLLLMDVLTGTIVSDVAESSLYVEIQTEQTIFGGTFFQWTNIKDIEANLIDINLYPNPASIQINLNLSTLDLKNANLVIYNSAGQIIRREIINQNFIQLNIQDLVSGAYTLAVFDKTGELLAKEQFIKR